MRPAINGAKWFTTPLNCPHSHPARNCPDMTSALNELIAGATTVESCRSGTAEMTQVLRAACRWRVSRSLHKCSLGATKREKVQSNLRTYEC